jgi:hypothetical protein
VIGIVLLTVLPFAGAVSETARDTPVWVIVIVCPSTAKVAPREFVDVLAATEKITVPFPEPLLPEVTLIHVATLVAVQAHPLAAVTLTLPTPPAFEKFMLSGDAVTLQAIPACATVNVWPSIPNVPVRESEDEFADTEYVTVPLPAPLVALVIVIQLALLATAHLQPFAELTVTLPAPPLLATLALVGETVTVQDFPP